MDAADTVKRCCADLYASDWARLLLGESFHPGGLELTERIGRLLDLGPTSRVLDVAAGQGASALRLARTFGCEVVGVELSPASVAAARERARAEGLENRVRFQVGDAEEALTGSFDVVLCECAFCTFPDKPAAARAMAAAVRPGGRVALSDLVRTGPLPPELEGLLAWVACIADARPLDGYRRHLEDAGFAIDAVEDHGAALAELVRDVRTRLMGAEVVARLKPVELPGGFQGARSMVASAAAAVSEGRLSYAVLLGTRR
jgi:arsenite methyltransferase